MTDTETGDTFWQIEERCPKCGSQLNSDGTAKICPDCPWERVL